MNTANIIEEILKEERSINLIDKLYDNSIQKWSLVIVGACFIFGAIGYFADPSRTILGGALIVGVISILVFLVNNSINQVKYIASASKEHLAGLSQVVAQEGYLIARLTAYDSWTLLKAKERLLFEVSGLESRVGSLVGALDKLGIFPALIALYMALAKFFKVNSIVDVPYLLIGFVIGIYLAAFSIVNITERLKAYAYLIGVAAELAKQAEDLK